MVYGVVATGFNRKRLDEISQSIKDGAIAVFGTGINLEPGTVDDQLHSLIASAIADDWELAEEIYHSIDIFQAEGVRLDILASIGGYAPRASVEDDEAFRIRILTPLNEVTNLVDQTTGQILQLDGVISANILINDSATTNNDGIPPYKFAVLVDGGDDAEIGKVIWDNGSGYGSYGSFEVEITDNFDICRLINFTRPAEVPIAIAITVSSINDSCETLDELTIKNLLLNNLIIIAGKNIILSHVSSVVAADTDIDVTSLTMGKILEPSEPLKAANINIAWSDKASLAEEDITVTITPPE